jgi:hypothetical protein
MIKSVRNLKRNTKSWTMNWNCIKVVRAMNVRSERKNTYTNCSELFTSVNPFRVRHKIWIRHLVIVFFRSVSVARQDYRHLFHISGFRWICTLDCNQTHSSLLLFFSTNDEKKVKNLTHILISRHISNPNQINFPNVVSLRISMLF